MVDVINSVPILQAATRVPVIVVLSSMKTRRLVMKLMNVKSTTVDVSKDVLTLRVVLNVPVTMVTK